MTEVNERLVRERRLAEIIQKGLDPYPARVNRSHSCHEVLEKFDDLINSSQLITLVGRVRSKRPHGGSAFLNIEDGTDKIQVYARKDELGAEQFTFFLDHVDIGDFIETSGKPYRTQRGEKSLLVEKARIISKALEPLPEKWHGLSDVETRYRQRYLDLIANPEVRAVFQKRALMIRAVRSFLDENGFLEVETPILQPIPGGALARPFSTHHHALDTNLFLRVAPELYLKRLIIGGYERVYEIARCFRNEGIDHTHNPEFTQVEFYAAYWDYNQMMKFTEHFLEHIVLTVQGAQTLPFGAHTLAWSPPYLRKTFTESISEYAKIDIDQFSDVSSLEKEMLSKGFSPPDDGTPTRAKLLDSLLKDAVRPHLIQPTFIYRYPIELSPLAKKTEDDPRYVERFQLFAGALELVNAFSELNDPLDQQERFLEQQKYKDADTDFHPLDVDFLKALAHGMPPTAGLGLGLDRFLNLLTNTHGIKDALLFPTLRPEKA